MDTAILNFIQSYFHNGFTDFVFPFITALGDSGIIWLVAALALVCSKKYRRWGILLVVSLLLTHVLGDYVIKPLVARPRPFMQLPGHTLLIAPPRDFSFPSGHTATAFCASFVLWRADKRFGTAAFVLALLIAFSRMFLFVHYPTDILAGAILGLICATLTIFIWKRLPTTKR